LLKKDDEVEFKILEISKENRKISLGLKQVTEDPWPMIETLFSVGSIVEGEVAKVTDKFIVVNLEHDLEGIIPLGQMPKKDRKDLSKAVEIGEKLQLKVLEVNRQEKKIILSREQAIPREPKTEVEAYMMQQAETTNKLEIPSEIIQKIAESEEKTQEKEEKSAAKVKSLAKKAKKAEKVEKPEDLTPEEEKPKKKSTKKVISEEIPAEEKPEVETKKETEASPEKTRKNSAKSTSKKSKPQAESEKPAADDTAEK